MDIALSPLIILMLAFPGVLFRYCYRKRVSFTFVFMVVEHENIPYVYGGVFDDCEFSSDGELDRIIITIAFRFPLPKEQSPSLRETPGFFDIDAERFVIQYSDVKTIALKYFIKEVEKTEPTTKST